ncbi:hypothetical protein DL1_17635 [Thioclava dalianensis]|uniref:Uncharacterized protein n=1 Tax=Thioclava dalianensis TaxID=1185766 RepID=A0A074TFM8_9RHOB|nr:hypothetical protein DL1_17635 [Thioclava dalianensis]
MKTCAARVASAGGRKWMMPGSESVAVTIIEAPTATPRIVRAPTEILPKLCSGRCASAPARQNAIAPKRRSSGRSSAQESAVPAAAHTKVRPRRCMAPANMCLRQLASSSS